MSINDELTDAILLMSGLTKEEFRRQKSIHLSDFDYFAFAEELRANILKVLHYKTLALEGEIERLKEALQGFLGSMDAPGDFTHQDWELAQLVEQEFQVHEESFSC